MTTIFPVPANMTSIIELLPFANSIGGSFLGIIILITIAVIVLIIGSSFSMREGLVSSGFITFFTALMLRFMADGIIDDSVLLFAFLYLMGAGIFAATSGRGGGA